MADEPNLRGPLVAALTAALPAEDWTIVGYPDAPERVEKRTVAVWAATIAPSTRLKAGQYVLAMSLEVLTPHQDVRQADDDLDGALLAVLDVLFAMPSIVFSSAERTTNDAKTAHAWSIRVEQILTVTAESPED